MTGAGEVRATSNTKQTLEQLDTFVDGLDTAVEELRRLTDELRKGLDAGPSS